MIKKWDDSLIDRQVILLKTYETGGTMHPGGVVYPDQAGDRCWIQGLYDNDYHGRAVVIVRKNNYTKDPDHPFYKQTYCYLDDLQLCCSHE